MPLQEHALTTQEFIAGSLFIPRFVDMHRGAVGHIFQGPSVPAGTCCVGSPRGFQVHALLGDLAIRIPLGISHLQLKAGRNGPLRQRIFLMIRKELGDAYAMAERRVGVGNGKAIQLVPRNHGRGAVGAGLAAVAEGSGIRGHFFHCVEYRLAVLGVGQFGKLACPGVGFLGLDRIADSRIVQLAIQSHGGYMISALLIVAIRILRIHRPNIFVQFNADALRPLAVHVVIIIPDLGNGDFRYGGDELVGNGDQVGFLGNRITCLVSQTCLNILICGRTGSLAVQLNGLGRGIRSAVPGNIARHIFFHHLVGDLFAVFIVHRQVVPGGGPVVGLV